MKVSKQQAFENREALLASAGMLFKERGIDGVGVADICARAGLTQGALYKHFADKQDLAAKAFAYTFRVGHDRTMGPKESRHYKAYLDNYLAPVVRDDMTRGCPLVSTACETGRQGPAMSRSFTDAFVEMRDGVSAALPAGTVVGDRDALATTIVAALVGAMAISRGVLKADQTLADEVLSQVRATLSALGTEQGHIGQ
ncbi:TetR/AcrR family transcriptional regulator [Comamonas sp. w2-DMI]|uniref:TetR/AcrR family transcriptional regulator n=1 Tax=Comamonas sp. w2-DMI TaxID=3126391 RepID=UPI0032E3A2F6